MPHVVELHASSDQPFARPSDSGSLVLNDFMIPLPAIYDTVAIADIAPAAARPSLLVDVLAVDGAC